MCGCYSHSRLTHMQLHVKSLSCFIRAQKRKSKQDQDVEANIIKLYNYL